MSPAAKAEVKEATLVDRLKKNLTPYYSMEQSKERVRNPAIPYDALEVRDWPADLEYRWVPAPGGTASDMHGVSEMANARASFIQKGWQFYPADEFRSSPEDGYPWLSIWDDDGGRVRAMDHWLLYADRDMEARKRRDNLRRWNALRDEKREVNEGIDASNKTRDLVESKRSRVTVAEFLKEGDTDN